MKHCDKCGESSRVVRIVLLVFEDRSKVWVCPSCREVIQQQALEGE